MQRLAVRSQRRQAKQQRRRLTMRPRQGRRPRQRQLGQRQQALLRRLPGLTRPGQGTQPNRQGTIRRQTAHSPGRQALLRRRTGMDRQLPVLDQPRQARRQSLRLIQPRRPVMARKRRDWAGRLMGPPHWRAAISPRQPARELRPPAPRLWRLDRIRRQPELRRRPLVTVHLQRLIRQQRMALVP